MKHLLLTLLFLPISLAAFPTGHNANQLAALYRNTISGSAVTILVPQYRQAKTRHLVIWTHGQGSPGDSFLSSNGCCEAIATDGIIQAASEASGNAWGNSASLADTINLRAYVVTTLGLTVNKTAFIGASMGGVLASLSVVSGNFPNCVGMIGISPALDLAWCYGASFTAPITAAYGISGDFPTKTAGHDPMLIATANYSGFNFRFYASPGDPSVLKSSNSDAFATKVSGIAASMTVVTCTGGHADPSQFQPSDYVSTLNSWMGGP